MSSTTPRPIRAHVGGCFVVLGLLLAVVLSLARPAGALGSPVDPVPAGVWPLEPAHEVVRGFDPPDDPWGAGHRGVDLLGSVGQRVRTALAGRVAFAGPLAGRGVVVVDHGDTRTTYEPVAAAVRVGDLVARGDPLGTLELAGSHCLPRACLHWGWLRGATYLDPLRLVGGGPIRLLPLWRSTPVVRAPVWRRPRPAYDAVLGLLTDLAVEGLPDQGRVTAVTGGLLHPVRNRIPQVQGHAVSLGTVFEPRVRDGPA